MKKILITMGIVASAAVAFAAGEPRTGVLGSVHDMRELTGSGPGSDGTNDRVCAFCHTPHHAYLSSNPSDYYPLWSRDLDRNNFAPYASSTINAIDWASDIAIGPTRLCMSCHDGLIAVDQHYGSIGTRTLTENIPGQAPGSTWIGGAAIGSLPTTLQNDHPVGFVYDTVASGPPAGDPSPALVQSAQAQEDPWIRQADDTLLYLGSPYNVKVADRLYTDPTDGSRYMTCATCHDVHNKKNADLTTHANYLVLSPQKDSALCLTCHIK
jgi:hypothetical protein